MPSLKLDFSSQSLQGRDEEISRLRRMFDKVQSEKQSRSVFLYGYSGSGKSRLASCSLEEYAASRGGYFATGKYDQQLMESSPYSAIVQASSAICKWIIANDRKELQSKFREKFAGEEHASFRHAVPALAALLCETSSDSKEETSSEDKFVLGALVFEQLKQSFRAFLGVVCDEIPIVFHLDDLQWADAPSLDIMQRLQEAETLHQILFVFSYRDNEVDEYHPLVEPIRNLEGHSKAVRIQVGDISKENVNKLVAGALQRSHDPASTQELSDAIYHKTNGNAFFTIQLLQLLHHSEILQFSFQSTRWEWDMNKIRSEMDSSDNVVDVVVRKLKSLPVKTALAMSIASCLGSRFDAQVMELILERWSRNEDLRNTWTGGRLAPTESPLLALQPAIDERLIEPLNDDGHYRFSHNRIQQAAYALMTDEHQRTLLHLRIGNLLWKLFRQEERSWLLLVTVDQLGKASDLIRDPKTRVDLARLYLQAALHVRHRSAFVPAANYLRQGIELLGDNKWADNYELSLEIHTLAAQTEFSCGRFELCRSRSGEVLVHATHVADKLPAQQTLVNCYSAESRWDDVFDLAYSAADKAGERLPKPGTRHILWELHRAKRAVKRLSDDDLLQLPDCTVTKERQKAWKIIADLFMCAWLADRENDFVLLAARMMRRTVEEGLCELSAFFVSMYGFVIAAMGDIAGGYRYGELAMKLQSHLEAKFENAKIYAAQTFEGVKHVYHFRHPIDQLLDLNFRQIYKKGIETGKINWAFSGLLDYIITYFYASLPLDIIIHDSAAFLLEMKDFKQHVHVGYAQMYRQCFLNMAGKSNNTALLQGEAVADLEMDKILGDNRDGVDIRHVQCASFVQLILAYHFQDYDLALKMADLHASFQDAEWPVYWTYLQPFYRALAYLAVFKRNRKKKYMKCADKDIKRVHWFCKNGMLNCVHLLSILKAERTSVLKRNVDVVRAEYGSAIVAAGRSGNLRDAALVCERAGLYFLGIDEKDDSGYYLSQAMQYYGEWGARANVHNIHVFSGLDERSSHEAATLKGRSRKAVGNMHLRKNISL